jgi:HEAT repeat protein
VSDDLILELAKHGVGWLLAGVACLAGLLLAHGVFARFIERRADRHRAALLPVLLQALEEPDGDRHFAFSLADRAAARAILVHLAKDLKGEEADGVVALYDRLGLLEEDRRAVRSWRWNSRARAISRLGSLRARLALPDLLEALDDRELQVRLIAVWAVGQAGDREGLSRLVTLLGDPTVAVAIRAEEVLAERGREVEDLILAAAGRPSNAAAQLTAIQLLGWLRVTAAVPLLLELMEAPEMEVRVKAVKASAAIGDPRFVESLHTRLRDEHWEVRCQAAKALSSLGGPSSLPHLWRAMQDPQWWVRLYAGTALAEQGRAGDAALQMAATDADSSVRDMAHYLLSRGALVPALP